MSDRVQSAFAAALTDRARPLPAGLKAWNGAPPERRFGVYRSNVAVGLRAALATRFAATERIVGADFFAAMAQDFIAAHPPRSPLLLAYGEDFPDFIATFAPAAGLAYLPDVARLETARGRAYHAADAAPLDPGVLARLAPDRIAGLVLRPHPAVSVLRSAHPVVAIWAMNAGEAPLAPIEEWSGEDALVVRPALTVEVRRLPPGGAVFLGALAAGTPLGVAAGQAAGEADGFDLTLNLTIALASGAFAALAGDHDHDPDA